jgi:phosphoribosylformylglycinamidine synthase subunit PurSL
MSRYRFIVTSLPGYNTEDSRLLNLAHHVGFNSVQSIDCQSMYWIEGELNATDEQILADLLHDSLIQICSIEHLSDTFAENFSLGLSKAQQTGAAAKTVYTAIEDSKGQATRINTSQQTLDLAAVKHQLNCHSRSSEQWIEQCFKPGVTDRVAEQIQQAVDLLGLKTIQRVASGQRWVISTQEAMTTHDWHRLARALGIDTLIHQYQLGGFSELVCFSKPYTRLPDTACSTIPLRNLEDSALLVLSQSRRLALNLQEMQAIQRYYQSQSREPTEIELEMIAQTWSEHCSHKSFRAIIQYGDQRIDGLLNHYLRAATEAINAPWVTSAFVDNAGIIDFDEEWQLAFKVETHNRPSAIEPFGGANTGLGGVIRDILGVSARPIAATDVFGLGFPDTAFESLPSGTLHPEVIRAGVVAGVEDYGNKAGIPTVNGAVVYDAGYVANPLVFCGCIGLLPKNQHPNHAQAGDHIIVLGGRTGRDGLGGATFSSQTMQAESGEVTGAVVQIGDPLLARGLIEVITRACKQQLYHAITDCGAGGLSSAVGELAQRANCGIEVNLAQAPLKYPGLKAWEIWLSESQERMILAVPQGKIDALKTLCRQYDIELTDLGQLNNSPQLCVYYQATIILQLDRTFLYGPAKQGGMPRKQFKIAPFAPPQAPSPTSSPVLSQAELEAMLLQLLNHPNITSKASIIRRYDHEIQGGAVIRPLVGIQQDAPSDACVLKPQGTKGMRGLVLSNGINPEFGKLDPYRMAVSVIDEAVRNAVAVGADPARIAILDNFCWGNVERPETLATLVECVRGCYDAALYYKTPFISGKDSLNNEYHAAQNRREAIPGTLLISALGIIENITQAISMDFKQVGNFVCLIGATQAHWGGSHFVRCGGPTINTAVPPLPAHAQASYRLLHQAMQQGWIRACHDLSEGGLSVALAEMCIGGRLGCTVVLNSPEQTLDSLTWLFSETNGRLLVEIDPLYYPDVKTLFEENNLSQVFQPLGRVEEKPLLRIQNRSETLIALSLEQLVTAWKSNITTLNF